MKLYLFVFCAAKAAAAGISAHYLEIRSDVFRYTTEIPIEWTSDSEGKYILPKGQPTPKYPMGIDVSFAEDEDGSPTKLLKRESELTDSQKSAQHIQNFSSSIIQRKGSWSIIETLKHDNEPAPLKEAVAALPVRGGFYIVRYYAREPSFSSNHQVFDHFIDSFKRQSVSLALIDDRDESLNVYLKAPATPWKRNRFPAENAIRYIGQAGPGNVSPPIITVQRFTLNKPFANADGYVAHQGKTSPGHKTDNPRIIHTQAGTFRLFETEDRIDTAGLPEISRPHPIFRSAFAVISGPDDFIVLNLQAPPATYGDHLKEFETMIQSFRRLKSQK